MESASVTSGRIAECAETLALAMQADPAARFIFPDPTERLAAQRELYARIVARALDEGRVDAWGDPIIAVAVWLRRPALGAATTNAAMAARVDPDPVPSPPDTAARMERFSAVVRRLREIARPDQHAYLDTIATLPAARHRGIASALLTLGHAWADTERLPCALDTLTDENVAFYRRRGYRVVASADMPEAGLQVTAMRRGARPTD